MTTVSSLVDSSLRLIRAIDSGSSASTSELTDAVNALNMMLSGWSTGPHKIYAITRESFTLTAGTGSYTIGTGGDFNTTMPLRITSAFFRNDSTDYPLDIIHSSDYAKQPLKSLESWPSAIYFEPTVPLGTIIFDYVPNEAFTLYIYSHKEFTTYTTDGTDTISLPPGYERAIKYNLAVEICPEYKADVPPLVMKIAKDSLEDIKRLNSHQVPMVSTNPFSRTNGGRTYKISGDTWVR